MADRPYQGSSATKDDPPTPLWRTSMAPLLRQAKGANAGLLIRRGMSKIASESGSDKDDLLKTLSSVRPCQGYLAAFSRWKSALTAQTNTRCMIGKISTRLYVGAVHDSALESGCTVHHNYGMPLIPGSSVKGVCRHAARAWGLDNRDDSDPATRSVVAELFGDNLLPKDHPVPERPCAGTVIFHDAWWVPDPGMSPFVREIVTPHHQDYYHQGKAAATDFDSPIPAPQLAVQGQFLFAVTGADDDLAAFAAQLLKTTLYERGIGSKTTSGYGYFDRPDAFVDLPRARDQA